MVKSIIEYEKYRYSIVVVTVTSLPIDDLLLGNIIAKHGYAIDSTQEFISATKQNSKIEINTQASKIQIDSTNLHELNTIQNELFQIITTECNFNSKKYPLCYQVEGEIILSNSGDPVKNIDKVILKPIIQNADKIFDQSLHADAIRLYNGDKYSMNYSSIEIAPRMGQENYAYYVKYLLRNENKEIVDKFILPSEAKILAFLNTLN